MKIPQIYNINHKIKGRKYQCVSPNASSSPTHSLKDTKLTLSIKNDEKITLQMYNPSINNKEKYIYNGYKQRQNKCSI